MQRINSTEHKLRGDYTRAVEDAFVNYFLNKVGPSEQSEKLRREIYSKVKFLIEKALGKNMRTKDP